MEYLKKLYWMIYMLQHTLSMFSVGVYGVALTLLPFELIRKYGWDVDYVFLSVVVFLIVNLWHGMLIEIISEHRDLYE